MKLRFLLKKKILRILASKLLAAYLIFVYRTSHFKYKGNEGIQELLNKKQPLLFCFWHGHLAMIPFAWIWPSPFFVMLSKNGDGQLIGDVVKSFSFKGFCPFDIVFGSTNTATENDRREKGGKEAALQAVRLLKKGFPVGITPDGPRGPRNIVSEGTVLLSYLAQSYLVPVSYNIRSRYILKTWDRFLLPLPFSKGIFKIGEIISYPERKEDLEEVRLRLQNELNRLNKELEDLLHQNYRANT